MTTPTQRPTLLLYCQHSLGIGHLTRSFALVQALTPHFEVVFLNGGRLPQGVAVPPGMTRIDLPPLGMDDGHTVVSRDSGASVGDVRERRRALIEAAVQRWRPDLLLVELFPFGRKKFAVEILPMIRAARRLRPDLKVVCSLRDILVNVRPDQQHHDDRARWLCDRYFDAVLVHADPALARLEDSFHPRCALRTPVVHTGYVAPERPAHEPVPARGEHVLVSAGGGLVGERLYRAVLAARRCMARPPPLRIVAGPFLPEPAWQQLQALTAGDPGVQWLRHVPGLAAEMRGARASISQCGYNSTMDLLVAQVPALVVPYATVTENEQSERARRLARSGALLALDADAADEPERLAAALTALLDFVPAPQAIAFDGARRSAQALQDLLKPEQPAPIRALPTPRRAQATAQCPVLAALDERPDGAALWLRDDDAGWGDEALHELLAMVVGVGAHIDLAVIPEALTDALARRLRQAPVAVGLHQHGLLHCSHEPQASGHRKSEFGPSRALDAQRHDLLLGRERLLGLLDGRLDALFTPPWNRVSPHTPALLAELGYAALSRDVGAPAQQSLPEIAVHTDFSRCWHEGGGPAVAEHLAAQIRRWGDVGLMLHHAVMDAQQRDWLAHALARWGRHAGLRFGPMRDRLPLGKRALIGQAAA